MSQGRDEVTSLVYLQWQDLYDGEKPFQVFSDIPPDAEDPRSTNLVLKPEKPERIHDLRGIESQFSLDQHAFTICHQPMPKTNLATESALKTEFLPHCEDLIRKTVTGADHIHCFDWGLRENAPLNPQTGRINVNDKMQRLEPAKQVHCDQSPAGAVSRLRQHLPNHFERATRGRLRIINLWRPFSHPVQDNPLAVCDGSTVMSEDLVEADHITRTYLGSTMYGLFSERHKWYYLSNQTPDEVYLLKIFDSDPDVPAHHCLHTSFLHSNIPKNVLPRKSVEARFLVITWPQDK